MRTLWKLRGWFERRFLGYVDPGVTVTENIVPGAVKPTPAQVIRKVLGPNYTKGILHPMWPYPRWVGARRREVVLDRDLGQPEFYPGEWYLECAWCRSKFFRMQQPYPRECPRCGED